MMFEFASVVKDLSKDYHENDAWPVFIDNLVEWINKKQSQTGLLTNISLCSCAHLLKKTAINFLKL